MEHFLAPCRSAYSHFAGRTGFGTKGGSRVGWGWGVIHSPLPVPTYPRDTWGCRQTTRFSPMAVRLPDGRRPPRSEDPLQLYLLLGTRLPTSYLCTYEFEYISVYLTTFSRRPQPTGTCVSRLPPGKAGQRASDAIVTARATNFVPVLYRYNFCPVERGAHRARLSGVCFAAPRAGTVEDLVLSAGQHGR
jgi:hypothetical protein